MSTRARSAASPARHPIQVVARRTGLSADVIRAWEKRYAVVAPARSGTGRRAYSDADVAHLQLLARATLSGRTIKQVAGLTPAALAALVRADAAPLVANGGTGASLAAPARPGTSAGGTLTMQYLAACLEAIERFDLTALDALLRRAMVVLSAEAMLDGVAVPFRDAMNESAHRGAHRGALHAAHERLALSALRRALDRVIDAATSPAVRPDLVVTTPLGQHHELGAVLATAVAAADGWHAVYAGAAMPAEAIAEAVARLGARAVLLGLGATATDRVVPRELRRLRALLSPDVALLVEGAAADAHRGALRAARAVVVRDPGALRTALRTALGARLDRGA